MCGVMIKKKKKGEKAGEGEGEKKKERREKRGRKKGRDGETFESVVFRLNPGHKEGCLVTA